MSEHEVELTSEEPEYTMLTDDEVRAIATECGDVAIVSLLDRLADAEARAEAALAERVGQYRELLRQHMLAQPMTDERDTYSDGYGNGLATAIQWLDRDLYDPASEALRGDQ